MAVAGAALRGKGKNLALVQLDRLGRREIVRSENHRLIGINAAFNNAQQVADQPACHVAHIRRARAHIGVVHRRKHFGKLLARLLHGIFRAAAFLFD